MNQHFKTILNFIQQSEHLTDEEKTDLLKATKEAAKELEITTFKLDRTEKVKRTTAILLEETIEELAQKRKVVESQNRELEIEASLERVRTVAMSISKPDDMLHVCRIISEQLELLKVREIRNVQTAIIYEGKGTYINYEFYAKHDKTLITEVDYKLHPAQFEFVHQMLKSPEELFKKSFNGAEVQDWYEYQKTTNQFADSYLNAATSLNYYWYSIGAVALGLSTYASLNEEELNLVKRFRNVFELAYKRYLDIENAVAQAREVQIQLALERVRARTMAMQKSEELSETAFELFQQFKELGESPHQITIGIIKETEGFVEFNITGSDGSGAQVNRTYNFNIDEPALIQKLVKSWKENKKSTVIELTGKDLADWVAHRSLVSGITDHTDYTNSHRFVGAGYFTKGLISISTVEALAIETTLLLERFSQVFDQTYTRFLDLQKAEAQAREAKIETSLERVRARAMAMQKSEELLEVIHVVSTQLQKLNLQFDSASFAINNHSDDIDFWLASPGQPYPVKMFIPYVDNPVMNNIIEAQKNELDFFADSPTWEEKNKWLEHLFENTSLKNIPQDRKDYLLSCVGFARSAVLMQHITLAVVNYAGIPYTPEENNIFKRFAQVFDQSYTRFIDLQKAEVQAREARIETALERVRSRTMAMQRSEELPEAANNLFLQVQALGIPAWSAGYCIWDEDKQGITLWISSEGVMQPSAHAPCTEDPSFIHMKEAYEKGDTFHVEEIGGEALVRHYKYMRTLPVVGEILDSRITAGHPLPTFQIFHCVYFSKGFLLFITYEPVPQSHDIFKRFAQVFDQTYTRFLDLQKAEAQAKEAQIEAALERVRSRSLSMHKSEELKEVMVVVFEKLKVLGLVFEGAGIQLFTEGSKDIVQWVAAPDHLAAPILVILPYTEEDYSESGIVRDMWMAKEKAENVYNKSYSFEEKNSFFKYAGKYNDFNQIPVRVREFQLKAPSYTISLAAEKHSALWIDSYSGQTISIVEFDVLKRIAKVFEQAYTRFLDLQKAEAQAREAQIQLALERIRARSMAMQHSEELQDTSLVLFQQLKQLGEPAEQCTIGIIKESEGVVEISATLHGNKMRQTFRHKIDEPFVMNKMFRGWKDQQKTLVLELKEDELKKYNQYRNKLVGKETFPVKLLSGDRRLIYIAYFSKGMMALSTHEPRPAESLQLLERFTKVFEQTYTRFLDLQKAEAQAREAQIEAALERVRSATIAMQKSTELAAASQTLFAQMNALVPDLWSCGFVLCDKNKTVDEWWLSGGNGYMPDLVLPNVGDRTHENIYQAWLAGTSYQEEILEGQELVQHYDWLMTIPVAKAVFETQAAAGIPKPKWQQLSCATFTQGYLVVITEVPIKEEEILKRFAKVFEQTYTRFLDLQKAEAQAKEAQIETALERVRSRTLAMQKSDELAETAVLLFKQLILLGIEPNRLYINIIKNETGEAEFWITDEDGSKVSSAFESNMNDNPTFKKMFEGWKGKKKSLMIDMKGKELEKYFQHLESLHVPFKDGLEQKRRLQYIAYFNKGFIGMASPDEQPEETMNLLERFAAVFNLTFTRFNDLKIAEAHAIQAEEDLIKLQTEKRRAEDALSELQVTQKQLIQSEKMASLGELTAGIAHEIQNPLNFVNNFSEVNKELLVELKDEIKKGNLDEVNAIADDVISNEEKILHHGKRADAIVKGMLQHSSSGSRKKEPTDINKLADEYLRLAYHGLRAKDKSFNATMKTDHDSSIGNINIISQDIGRVILNLITNAFYAVDEKKKSGIADYQPTVSVSTKKLYNSVEIRVADNGNGIPQKILDKIFQPFFTTKPTGQGTGLGLSLSYDIVKAHGGDLKVETKEAHPDDPVGQGEGSVFIIQLPVV